MKKTLLSFAFAFVLNFSFAQQTISFENSEGFTLGNINAQNGWTSTTTNEEGTEFVENQVISSEEASQGTNSFKLVTEDAFPSQSGPVIGGFYTFPSPVAREGAVVSFDFKITDGFNFDGNDYRFALTGPNALGVLSNSAITQIRFNGNIAGVNGTAFANLGPTWTEGEWINVKMEFTGNQVAYSVNGTLLISYAVITPVDNFTGFRIVHDNYGGTAYFDNIRINDEDLSSESFNVNSFKHFVNSDGFNFVSDSEISNIEFFNTIGQNVISQKLNSSTGVVSLNNLSSGIYLAIIETTDGQNKTVKFNKN